MPQITQDQFNNIIDLLGAFASDLAVASQEKNAYLYARSNRVENNLLTNTSVISTSDVVENIMQSSDEADRAPSVVKANEKVNIAYDRYIKALRNLYFSPTIELLSPLKSLLDWLKTLPSVYTELERRTEDTGYTMEHHSTFQEVKEGFAITSIMAQLNRDFTRAEAEEYQYTGRYVHKICADENGTQTEMVFGTLIQMSIRPGMLHDAVTDTSTLSIN